MQLTFLGTSSGVPTASRNVTALALRHGGSWDLFDCGEATQHRLLATPLSLPKLRRVFISHLHGDHCYGLFGLLGSRSMARATTQLDIYGPAGLQEMVDVVLATSDTHVSYPIEFHVVPTEGRRVVDTDDEIIDAIPLDHRVTSFAWHIREAERPGAFDADRAKELGVQPGPDYGRLQRGETVEAPDGGLVRPGDVVGPARPGRSLIIAGDNRDPATLLNRTGPVQLMVHESTYTEEVVAHLGEDQGHSTAARVSKAAQDAGVQHLVLTHFSPRYAASGGTGQTIDEIRQEAEAHYRGTLALAEDYATFELGPGGEFSSTAPILHGSI